MNTFRQRIPAFVETDGPPPVHEFSTTEELLSLEVVKRYKGPDFSHFAMSGRNLMVIDDDGFYWWVVGSVASREGVDLPEWSGWKFRAQLKDGTKVVLSDEVESCCGNVLTLKDGSTAINIGRKGLT